jgi:hypothetical protein
MLSLIVLAMIGESVAAQVISEFRTIIFNSFIIVFVIVGVLDVILLTLATFKLKKISNSIANISMQAVFKREVER